MARGLILDPANSRVVATPFEKFFNVGEMDQVIPDLPFETFEKLDGSLIVIFFVNGEWRAATKGSFRSDQAVWAKAWLDLCDLSSLDRDTTYLAEAIYPANRIVIHYETSGLFLLGAYDGSGTELSYDALQAVAETLCWPVAKRHQFASVSDLIAHTGALPATEEGYVIRFSNGLRLKIKGSEYKMIHQLISRCTPLAMWEAMMAGDDMTKIRRDLPEEFWADYDAITAALGGRITAITHAVAGEAAAVSALSDKEVGLRLPEFSPDVRSFIFPFRKTGTLLEGRTRAALFRHIRPTGNRMDGYTPSYAMNRVAEEMV